MDSVSPRKCSGCQNGAASPHALRTAFQPIYDLNDGSVFAYEALVRGENGEGAAEMLSLVNDENLYAFDQACRVAAIRQAVAAGLLNTRARLSINFMPNAVYSPMACIQLTLKTAREVGLAEDRLIFELTENERVDIDHVSEIVAAYHALGFATAIDDFGAGYAGLNLLANLRTDLVKLDMELVRGIDCSEPRRQIVYAIVRLCAEMGRQIIAEGIETQGELEALQAMGIHLVQGFHLARPALGHLAPPLSLQPMRMVS